jgi:ABC-2 type transport system permease protein
MKLFAIMQKNFKILLRSKVSALIIFLGPLLLVSLIGLSFSNTQLPGLNVGTYSGSYNDFTNSIISKIQEQKFVIDKFDSKDDCSNAVKQGDASICLVFPSNMDKDNNEVSFVVDYSKINLVWVVLDIISNRVSERATELRTSYATDLITKVILTRDDLSKQKEDVSALGSKQNEATTSLKGATETLGKISPTTEFGTEVDVDEAKDIVSTTISHINDANDNIDDARSKVESAGLSAEDEADIVDELDDAEAELDAALSDLEGNNSVDSLEFIVSELGNSLDNAKAQLEDIKSKKSVVQGNLVTLQGAVDDSIKTISALDAALSDTLSRISSVQTSDAAQLVSPIRTKIEPVTTVETHFNYLFPTLIVLIVMITSVLLSSTFVMNEKKSRSYFRNFITPTSDSVFNVGTFLSAFLVIVVQLVIFMLISALFFSTGISSLSSAVMVLVLVTSAFILLGMIVGFLFKSEETSVLAAITVSALLLFLSSTVMPIESISNSIRGFASVTPFVVSENLLRQVMFFNFGLESLTTDFALLAGYVIVFAAVIVVLQKLMREKISIKFKKRQ